MVDGATAKAALETMRELYSLVDEKFFKANPIAVAEYMTSTDDYWYCPFAYGYSNYSRDGYARRRLVYADLVRMGKGRLRSTIGGTGLAVSAFSRYPDEALAFAEWVVSPEVQSTFYMEHGGSPGTGWRGPMTGATGLRIIIFIPFCPRWRGVICGRGMMAICTFRIMPGTLCRNI
ncbi:hypothetical protein ACQ86N_33530 [Puia sp. P3]|uniref:hypothetical protein n=1 Tax=Puia sp. P3 TaxID=3423952 RepID=UPI003D67EB66